MVAALWVKMWEVMNINGRMLRLTWTAQILFLKRQTKGYDSYEGDNIMLTVSVLARLTTSLNVNYKLNIDGIIQSLASKGVQMISPIQIQGTTLVGLEWDLNKHCEPHEKY